MKGRKSVPKSEDVKISEPTEAGPRPAFEEPSISPAVDLLDPKTTPPMMALIGPGSGEI